MKKAAALIIALLCLKTAAFAAEYNLKNNLLFGLSPDNVKISTGNISTNGDTSKTTQVLYDGFADSVKGNTGTRWAVEKDQYGAELEINFDKVENIGKVIVASGYSDVTAQNPEIFEAFEVQYFDGSEYVKAAEIKNNSERNAELDFEPIYTKKLKIVSRTNNNFRIREVIVLPPGKSMYDQSPVTDDIKVTYNGSGIKFYKDKPMMSEDGGRVLVPLRSCAEALGAKVTWLDDIQKAEVKSADKTILFAPDSNIININGEEYDADTKTLMLESRVYIPVRIFGEMMNYEVNWDGDTDTVNIISYEKGHMINPGNREYTKYRVYADGKQKDVFTTTNCDFVQISADAAVKIEVDAAQKLDTVDIRPLSLNIKPEFEKGDDRLSFTAEPGQFLSVEMNGDLERPLFVYVNKKIETPNDAKAKVLYYEGGKHHNIGIKSLDDNTTVYLGENAIIDGGFTASKKKNIKILGNGIINGTAVAGSCTAFFNCENVEINGPVAIGANQWLNRWFAVDGGNIRDYKILGSIMYSDGIDLLGSKNINIDHIFVRNEDDCVAIKTKKASETTVSGNVENISIKNSVFWNGESGNSMEIGYELDGDYVRNVEYKNIDVIHRGTKANKFNRAVISIHHAGNSVISDILYDEIRVESTDEGLVNLSFFDMPNWGSGGGRIENVTIKNLTLLGGADAPSYFSTSANPLKNPMTGIVFENLTYKGKKITSVRDAIECGFKIDPGVDINFKQ